MVKCEIKSFQNYFSLHLCPSEILLFQRVETSLKLFHRLIAAHEYLPTCLMSLKYFWDTNRTLSLAGNNFISVSDVATCETKQW